MKKFLIKILYGMCIGFAVIIPGVSGGTIASLFGIYDEFLDSITGLRKNFKKSISFLGPLLIGIVLSVLALFYPISKALEYIPFPTISFFSGLILGGVYELVKDNKKNDVKFNLINIVIFAISFIIVVGLGVINICVKGVDVNITSTMDNIQFLLIFLIGILASCALIVPGISGSMILLILGYYGPVLELVKGVLDAIIHGNTATLGHDILVLALFALGIIVGFFSVAYLMKWLLKKFPIGMKVCVFGLVVGSVIAVFLAGYKDYAELMTLPHIIGGVVAFIVGTAITFTLGYFVDKKATQIEEEQNIEG